MTVQSGNEKKKKKNGEEAERDESFFPTTKSEIRYLKQNWSKATQGSNV